MWKVTPVRWTGNPPSGSMPPVFTPNSAPVHTYAPPRQAKKKNNQLLTAMLILVIAIIILVAVGVLLYIFLQPAKVSTIQLKIVATKMSVQYFEKKDILKFRQYEAIICSDIKTILENQRSVQVFLTSCELQDVQRYYPEGEEPGARSHSSVKKRSLGTQSALERAGLTIPGTTFIVHVVMQTEEIRPRDTLVAVTRLMIAAGEHGKVNDIHLPSFSLIDEISFPNIDDTGVIFTKEYCFNIELNVPSIEHDPKLSVDDPAQYLAYEQQYCSDVRRLFQVFEVANFITLVNDQCRINMTESFITEGEWPPGTTFVLWIQVRRVKVLTEAMALFRLNQELDKALHLQHVGGRAVFIDVTSGQAIKCRKPEPPVPTTTTAPPPPTEEPCEEVEITVPATVITGTFKTNLEFGLNTDPTTEEIMEKIKELPYVQDILHKCSVELNCVDLELFVLHHGDPLGHNLKFSIKVSIVISATESPTEVAMIVASQDPKGYSRNVEQVTVTVPECEIQTCETYHGGCPDACSTHACQTGLGEGFSCRCPDDQILVEGECTDAVEALQCYLGYDLCILEYISGDVLFNGIGLSAEPDPDNEVVLALNMTTTEDICLTIRYTFISTCSDNYVTLEDCWGSNMWSAKYGLDNFDRVTIPAGLTDLIFRIKTVGPLIAIDSISAYPGPCQKVRLTGGESPREGIVEYYFDKEWHAVCELEDPREVLPNLCNHLGFENAWDVYAKPSDFEKSETETVVTGFDCQRGYYDSSSCSTRYIQECDPPTLSEKCPRKMMALRCADMAPEPLHGVRMVAGPSSLDGIAQVFVEDEWHTLGLENYHEPFTSNAELGALCGAQGHAPIAYFAEALCPGYPVSDDLDEGAYWLNLPLPKYGIKCVCGATDLSGCKLYELEDTPSERLALYCDVIPKPPIQDRIEASKTRLVGPSGLDAGRLEIKINGRWGTACYDPETFDDATAGLVCKLLGKGDTGMAVVSQWAFGTRDASTPAWLNDLQCTGTEQNINECACADFDQCGKCNHRKDVAIACGSAAIDTVLSQVEVRLANTKTIADGGVRGLVEVRRRDLNTHLWTGWGTVCDDLTTFQNVHVICNMLGYKGGEQVLYQQCGSYSTAPILLDAVECGPYTNHLAQCLSLKWGENNCRHNEDLCVACNNQPLELFLDDIITYPDGSVDGLVVMSYAGRTGIIGADNAQTYPSADTVQFLCAKSLGVPVEQITSSYGFFFSNYLYYLKHRAAFLYNLDCPIDAEDLLEDCKHGPLGVVPNPYNHLHIVCTVGTEEDPTPSIQPWNPGQTMGDVIVKYKRSNGVICGKSTDLDADIMCKQMGFVSGQKMLSSTTSRLGLVRDLRCKGHESDIFGCSYKMVDPESAEFCDPEKLLAVRCFTSNPVETKVSVRNQRLMVSVDGHKAVTVCADTKSNPGVVSNLCPGSQGTILKGSKFTQEKGMAGVLLSNVVCSLEVCQVTQVGMAVKSCRSAIVVCNDGAAGSTSEGEGGESPTTGSRHEVLYQKSENDAVKLTFTSNCNTTIVEEGNNTYWISSSMPNNGLKEEVAYVVSDGNNGKLIVQCADEDEDEDGSITRVTSTTVPITEVLPSPRAVNCTGWDYSDGCIYSIGEFDVVNEHLYVADDEAYTYVEVYPLEDSTVCITVNKTNKGDTVVLKTKVYTSFRGSVTETSFIHSEPTEGYEEVCVRLYDISRPAVGAGGFIDVEIFAMATEDSEIWIDDLTIYPGDYSTPPPVGKFLCLTGNQYVDPLDVCNGPRDCYDGSDERNCGSVYCDFDYPCPGWTHEGDFHWKYWAGASLTPDTGPPHGSEHGVNPDAYIFLPASAINSGSLFEDHTRYYLLMDNIDGSPNEEAHFVYDVDPADQTQEGCLSFDYSSIGRFVAHLEVEAETTNGGKEVLFRMEGQNHRYNRDPFYAWRFVKVHLPAGLRKIRFIGVRGAGPESNIAIDRVYLKFGGPCQFTKCKASLQFTCDDGNCINGDEYRDGTVHCPDGSDERDFVPSEQVCLKSEYQCKAGGCIDSTWVCDNYYDCSPDYEEEQTCTPPPLYDCDDDCYRCDREAQCPDGRDEVGCPYNIPAGVFCPVGYFALATGNCIPQMYRCDGQIDAYDRSDERDCGAAACRPEKYLKTCGAYCLIEYAYCDGIHDCEDDELPGCSSTNFLCQDNSFLLPGFWYCDGYFDCYDYSSEPIGCECNSTVAHYCPILDLCISIYERCDGVQQCVDGSDEQDCDAAICNGIACNCPHDKVPCSNMLQCVDRDRICDKSVDCDDCSDESDAKCASCDPGYQFTCNNGDCISLKKVSDGKAQCPDGEDEKDISLAYKICKDGKGVFGRFTECNGVANCGDESDEEACSCGEGSFQCQNGVCISEVYRCNGNQDCTDGSDEFCCHGGFGHCFPHQWECLTDTWNTRVCIEETDVCDRRYDCFDHSDEVMCANDHQRPSDGSIKLPEICDGVEDYVDGSDEHGCPDIGPNHEVIIRGLPVCSANWSPDWTNFICSANGYGWIGSQTIDAAIPADVGEFSVIPLEYLIPNNSIIFDDTTVTSCNIEASVVQVDCPRVRCGHRTGSIGGDWDATNQIIGGYDAGDGWVPWMAALYRDNDLSCSASVINQCWVATAAHCVYSFRYTSKVESRDLNVLIGPDRANAKWKSVSRVVFHPEYYGVYDFALIQLSECLDFDDEDREVVPLCLPHPNQNFVGEYCETAGLGRVLFDGEDATGIPLRAQILKTSVQPDEFCENDPGVVGYLYNRTVDLCLGEETEHRGTCFGDSGGPTYCSYKKKEGEDQIFFLAGITSYGSETCVGKSVQAKVTSGLNWMLDVMETHKCNCVKGCKPWSIYD